MNALVQARLDDECQKIMEQLVKETGWTPSKVVREGVKLLAACHLGKARKRRIYGMGQFDSGVPDLGSNKKHMAGFGK
jgi:hypothetical protein